MLGRPLACDPVTADCSRLSYARICVELDARDAPYQYLWLALDGKHIEIEIEYEWLPKRCPKCGTWGHTCPDVVAERRPRMPPRGRALSADPVAPSAPRPTAAVPPRLPVAASTPPVTGGAVPVILAPAASSSPQPATVAVPAIPATAASSSGQLAIAAPPSSSAPPVCASDPIQRRPAPSTAASASAVAPLVRSSSHVPLDDHYGLPPLDLDLDLDMGLGFGPCVQNKQAPSTSSLGLGRDSVSSHESSSSSVDEAPLRPRSRSPERVWKDVSEKKKKKKKK